MQTLKLVWQVLPVQAARVRTPYNLKRAASDCQHQNSWTAAISGLITDLKSLLYIPGAAPMVFHA